MSTSVAGENGRFIPPEPIFRDVPFRDSQWHSLYELLRKVNSAKAELLVSAYEDARIAYQNYHQAKQEAYERYAQQRPLDAEHNRNLRAEEAQLHQAMRAIYEKWQPIIEKRLEDYLQALQDAHVKGARIGLNRRGDPMLGIGSPTSEDSTPTTPEVQSQTLPAPLSEPTGHLDTPSPSPERLEEPPPRTESEVAHERNLPSVKTSLLPSPLWWALVVVGGMFTGLLLLVALRGDVSAVDQLEFWLAMLGGVILHLLWVPALWGASATVGELYHLFRWDEGKSRASAWVVGIGLMALPITLFTLLLILIGTVAQLRSNEPLQGLVIVMTALLWVPTVAIAVLRGYLYGRSLPVQHQLNAEITQAVRQHLGRQKESAKRASPTASNSLQEVTTEEMGETPSESAERAWREFYEAEARTRACWAIYRFALEQRQEELQPFQQALARLDWRPLYDPLPPHMQEQLNQCLQQWEVCYRHFLELLKQAVRELNDGEELARIVEEHERVLFSASEKRALL